MSFWTQLLISNDTKKYKVNFVNFGHSKSQKGGLSSFKPVALKLDHTSFVTKKEFQNTTLVKMKILI